MICVKMLPNTEEVGGERGVVSGGHMMGAEQTAVLSGSELSPSPPSDCSES